MSNLKIRKEDGDYYLNGYCVDIPYREGTTCCGIIEIEDLECSLNRNLNVYKSTVSIPEIVYHTIKAALYAEADDDMHYSFALVSLINGKYSKALSKINGVVSTPIRANPNSGHKIQGFLIDIRKFRL